MALRVRDVRDLEGTFRTAGSRLSKSIEETLTDAEEWFEKVGQPKRILNRQTLAHLCEVARSEPDGTDAHELALGALEYIKNRAAESPELASFAACHAVRKIADIRGRPLQWNWICIPPSDEERADSLFRRSLELPSHSDDEILSLTLAFIDRYASNTDMFGRFAQDLEALVGVVCDPDAPEEHRDIARAALEYFVEDSDAIPDHLGLVGLLDDAFVVRRALEHIHPGRAALGDFLDRAVADWPFLLDLIVGDELDEFGLSEFMIINAALLASSASLDDGHPGRVVIVPEPGPLPGLIGWVRSIQEARSFLDEDDAPRFAAGDRLVDRGSRAELIFVGYGRFEGSEFSICGPSEATHFRVTHPAKGGDLIRTHSIDGLTSLQHSARSAETLRRGRPNLDAEAAPLGALERILGATRPIAMPDQRGRVIVVAPLRETRALLHGLRIHGVPLTEVVPVEQVRFDGESVHRKPWTMEVGGDAIVTVVRTAQEALELAELDERATRGVVAAVRPGSTDAVHLARIAGEGIPVLAITEERDEDSQETFNRRRFAFWNWADEWLGCLHWNRASEERADPISDFERGFRRRASATISIHDLELDGAEEAERHLRALERAAREGDDELLDEAIRLGFGTLLGAFRCVGPVDELRETFSEFESHVGTYCRWWAPEVSDAADLTAKALRRTISSLEAGNPKADFVREWSRTNPGGSILARSRAIEAASRSESLAGLDWIDLRHRKKVEGPVLVPSWMGASTMTQLLIPPIANSVSLALYGPEKRWYEGLQRRRERARSKLRSFVRHRSPIPVEEKPPEAVEPDSPAEPLPDEVIDRVRRARAVRKLGPADHDPVDARFVYFLGGYWAAFSPDHRVNSVTHLLEAGADQSEDGAIEEKAVSDLRAGEKVLVVRGSGHDAIRHAADADLPEDTRELAGEWRAAIMRFLMDSKTYRDLQSRLERHGCSRTQQTLRGWVRDERIIGPMNPGNDVVAIQRATGDPRLEERLESCLDAISMVRSAHMRASYRLAQRVMAKARSSLTDAGGDEDVVELDDRLLLLTVESVDGEITPVPRHAVNRIRTDD